jgi:ABC-type nitrate/sulfonate/bicarbonate transport system permease component
MRKRELLFGILGLTLIWQIAAIIVDNPILPGPLEVAAVFVGELGNGLAVHFLVSLWRVLISVALAIVVAAPLGLVLGQSKGLDRFISPIVYVLYPIPKIVFLPIILLLLGVGDVPKVFIIFLILFFQILVLVRDNARNINEKTILSVKSLGAGRRALFRYVYFPASLPAILTALRQSVGTAVAVLYIAELFATQYGLGYYIYLSGNTLFNYPAMYAGVVAMSLLGLGMYFTVDWLEKRLCPWQHLT